MSFRASEHIISDNKTRSRRTEDSTQFKIICLSLEGQFKGRRASKQKQTVNLSTSKEENGLFLVLWLLEGVMTFKINHTNQNLSLFVLHTDNLKEIQRIKGALRTDVSLC